MKKAPRRYSVLAQWGPWVPFPCAQWGPWPLSFCDEQSGARGLLRLLSQAGSLCVSSAFENGGVVLAVGPALHTFPLELVGEVQNFPASFSSSELSPTNGSQRSHRALAESSRTPAQRGKSVRKCSFATFSSRFSDIVLCTMTNGEDETISSSLMLTTFMPSKLPSEPS